MLHVNNEEGGPCRTFGRDPLFLHAVCASFGIAGVRQGSVLIAFRNAHTPTSVAYLAFRGQRFNS